MDKRVVGVASEESVGKERNDSIDGRHIQNSDAAREGPYASSEWLQEGSGMGRTSAAAPHDLYSYYGPYVSLQGRRFKAVAYRQ